MKIKTLASGSKGNASIILCGKTKLLIDIGISYLSLKRKLEESKLCLEDFDALLITHTHADHIKGLSSLTKHSNICVYIKEGMYEDLKDKLYNDNIYYMEDEFMVRDVSIELIHTSHDAPSSVGYIITYQNKSLVYVTDTGYINRNYLTKMKAKDIYLIESNHDEKMLMEGPYPYYLKQRVISDRGHLSNKTTAKYLENLVGENTKYVILAHLSEKNNTEDLAKEAVCSKLENKNIEVLIARQEEESPFIEV